MASGKHKGIQNTSDREKIVKPIQNRGNLSINLGNSCNDPKDENFQWGYPKGKKYPMTLKMKNFNCVSQGDNISRESIEKTNHGFSYPT